MGGMNYDTILVERVWNLTCPNAGSYDKEDDVGEEIHSRCSDESHLSPNEASQCLPSV